MSSSPKEQQEETVENPAVDELEEPQQEAENGGGRQLVLFNHKNFPNVDLMRCSPLANVTTPDI